MLPVAERPRDPVPAGPRLIMAGLGYDRRKERFCKLNPHGNIPLVASTINDESVDEWKQQAGKPGATFKIVKIWSEEVEVPEEE